MFNIDGNEWTEKKEKPYEEITTKWSAQLANHVRVKTKKSQNLKTYIRQFKELREVVADDSKITTTLQWYIKHAGEE